MLSQFHTIFRLFALSPQFHLKSSSVDITMYWSLQEFDLSSEAVMVRGESNFSFDRITGWLLEESPVTKSCPLEKEYLAG